MGGGNKPNTRNNNSSSSSLENITMDEKLNILLSDVGQIKVDNKKCLSEVSALKTEFNEFKRDINQSIENCYEEIKSCKDLTTKNTSDINSCNESIDYLRCENVALRKELVALKKRTAAADQYSRNNCLEIRGVPEKKSENIVSVCKQVATALNFNLEDAMIDAVHRLAANPNKPGEPRGIILRFCRRLDMEEMRRRARVKTAFSASELGFQSESKVTVNLSLTKDTRILWAAVQSFKTRKNFKFSWITNSGKIFLRRREGEAAILISDVSDLDRIK